MAIELLPEAEDKVRVNVYMPKSMQAELQRIARASKRSVNLAAVLLLERAIADLEREGRVAL